jgi:uncharacterized protein YdaU (DUF1376 family)
LNFYKHYIGDFQRDTGHLSLTERGAYLCLIHHYYATEKPLPNDLDALCRIAGAVSKVDRAAVKVAIGFFEPVASGLMHARIEAELEKAGEISNTNRAIALAREEKRRTEKAKRTEHEQSTKRAQSVPRTEHEQSTNQTPDTKVNLKTIASSNDLTSGSPGEEPSAAARFAVAIRGWEKARGKMTSLQASDPRVQAWGDAKVTDEQLALAYDWAVGDREANSDASPINAGFLDVFVAKVLKPAIGTSAVGKLPPPKPWFMSASGIEAKAHELGVAQAVGEIFPNFRGRVFAAAGVTEEMVRREKIDAGGRV